MRLLRRGGERGIALLMVLSVISLLTIIASEYSQTRRVDTLATRNFMEEMQAYYYARAGLNLAAAEILRLPRCVYRDPTSNVLQGCAVAQSGGEEALTADKETAHEEEAPPTSLARLQLPQGLTIGHGAVRVTLIDDESSLNLNFASRRQLNRLARFTGVLDEHLRNSIVDSILDWRDRDTAKRLNGAENAYYKGLAEPYAAKNGRFDSVEELLLVRCVSPLILYGTGNPRSTSESQHQCPEPEDSEVYLGLIYFLTIAGRGRVNINTASPLVLQTLGMTPSLAEQVIAGRPHRRIPRQARRYRSLTTRSSSFSVVAEGFFPGAPNVRRISARIEARRSRSRGGPILISAWNDNVLHAPQPPQFKNLDEEEIVQEQGGVRP